MIDTHTLQRLQAIGLTPLIQSRLHAQPAPEDAPFLLRVTEVHRDALTLHDGEREHAARARPALLQALSGLGDGLAAGDWVYASRNPHGEWWVHARVPPASQLARRLHDGRSKVTRAVIASNVDTALLVMGLDHDFNLRRLERYLALVRQAGIGAVVVLTKADLCADVAARLREVQALLPAGMAAVALNALSGAVEGALAPWLGAGQTLVLLGSSGAGKSTLTNALVGAGTQDTGGTRDGDGRGRHTTTARSLHRAAGGACIIDTPGLRTLRLDGDEAALAGVFEDIAALALRCRFRDCTHQAEPGCAVREGAPPERLRNFHKLEREAARDTMSVLERQRQVGQWKARGRLARARLQAKRG
jgi:ribosome biogenesis GTPase / thiamine phosphate phosphatase